MMKDGSKTMCGHGVSVNRRNDGCLLHIFLRLSVLRVPLFEERKHAVTVPESRGIRSTNDRHTSLCILQV